MKNVFLTFLTILLYIITISACNPTEVNKSKNTKTPIYQSKIQSRGLADELPLLEQESEKRSYKNGVLAISVLPADVWIGNHEPLLKELFPNGIITIADATELIDAFNIEYNGENYSVALTYSPGSDASFVLDKIYVFEEKFSIDLLNKIL